MGINVLPSIDDYWSHITKVPHVADVMTGKRFKLLRSSLHFNNNEDAPGSQDRFFKIRPIIDYITNKFQQIKETPIQSIDEVMVAYKGTRAGNLRQYIKSKPDPWGFKLFCRGSSDGIIHDIITYQGASTFETHKTKLTSEESGMNLSSKIVICLSKTMKKPEKSTVYADNFFTSLSLVEYLLNNYGCRYTGTVRDNRAGKPNLLPTSEFTKKKRGTLDYCSSEGVMALKWKDNKVVTLLSSDTGIYPMSTVNRYDKETKTKRDIPCPNVIKQYNCHMGGIDKSDMLVHLYKTPFKAHRWYMRMFGYIIDVCITNAWLLYKRDCASLKEQNMSLKSFRLDISQCLRGVKITENRRRTDSPNTAKQASASSPSNIVIPKKGQKRPLPPDSLRLDRSKLHGPMYTAIKSICQFCNKHGTAHRSRWICKVCQVALCLSGDRNCYNDFHEDLSL